MKRAVDVVGASVGLVVLAVPMLVIAVLVRMTMGTPVLFRQRRPGLDEVPFTIYKFRTMTDARDAADRLLSDTERLTPLGRFLRGTELDELPGLVNVLKGEMSLVGPRPLFMKYLPYFTERERIRHAMKPGLTGWAQIRGLNRIPWDERLKLDGEYVENWSLRLDFLILARTIPYLVAGSDRDADPRRFVMDFDEFRRKENEDAAARTEVGT